jgi:hypothetical protein
MCISNLIECQDCDHTATQIEPCAKQKAKPEINYMACEDWKILDLKTVDRRDEDHNCPQSGWVRTVFTGEGEKFEDKSAMMFG